jgi:hypothetical protein
MTSIRKTGPVETPWGTEIVWASTDTHCGKILVFSHVGATTPILFNKVKVKSWFVNSGNFAVRWIDVTTGEAKQRMLKEGDVFTSQPLQPHQLEALTADCMIFESGTAEIENDIFKLTSDSPVVTQPPEL